MRGVLPQHAGLSTQHFSIQNPRRGGEAPTRCHANSTEPRFSQGRGPVQKPASRPPSRSPANVVQACQGGIRLVTKSPSRCRSHRSHDGFRRRVHDAPASNASRSHAATAVIGLAYQASASDKEAGPGDGSRTRSSGLLGRWSTVDLHVKDSTTSQTCYGTPAATRPARRQPSSNLRFKKPARTSSATTCARQRSGQNSNSFRVNRKNKTAPEVLVKTSGAAASEKFKRN